MQFLHNNRQSKYQYCPTLAYSLGIPCSQFLNIHSTNLFAMFILLIANKFSSKFIPILTKAKVQHDSIGSFNQYILPLTNDIIDQVYSISYYWTYPISVLLYNILMSSHLDTSIPHITITTM